jgi:hypothetical protein
MGHTDDGRVVHVRLLAEPCLWFWEIRDGVDGRLVESSWANEWVGFASRADAAAAGARRLAELRAAGSAGRAAASARPPRAIVAEPDRRAG